MSLINIEEEDLIRQAKLLQYANTKRITGEFNDVTIHAGAERISANRMVLACFSKFFESMFLSPLKEKYQNTVEIKEFDGEAVKAVIEFIYCGKINLNSNNVLTLLGTADFLQVDKVKKMCFDFLETSLTVDSCLDVVKASLLYNNPTPLQQTFQYISANFDEIVETDNFKLFSRHDLLWLFSSIDRSLVQESSIYTAIMNWVKYDQDREAEFSSLFLTLDLDELSSEFVIDTVIKEPLIKLSNECLNAVVTYLAVNTNRNVKKEENPTKILCIGGDSKRSVMEVYSVLDKSQKIYPDLPMSLSKHCVLKHDDFIYCIGGAVKGERFPNSEVYRLNYKAQNSQWEKLGSMIDHRFDFGAAMYNGTIVVAGGYGKFKSRLNTTEVYESGLNRWKKIASLNRKRDEHALVVANNKLFAIGGSEQVYIQHLSVEQLDELKGKWREIASMNERRALLAAVSCNNFIYAIGGLVDNIVNSTVEKYDLQKNDWSFVKSMKAERYCHAACVLEDKIFVIGGKDRQDNIVKAIECYDPVSDEWTVIGETEQDFYSHAVVAI